VSTEEHSPSGITITLPWSKELLFTVQVLVERKHGELIINAASTPLSQTKPLNKYAKIIAVKTFNAFIFTSFYLFSKLLFSIGINFSFRLS
jgi:hypothetical protein